MQSNTAQKCIKQVQPAKESNILATAKPGITKFRMDIHADQVYSHTGYEVTGYFWSAFIKVKRKKAIMLPLMALDQILVVQRLAYSHQLVGVLFMITSGQKCITSDVMLRR